jgi:hypothetical protein
MPKYAFVIIFLLTALLAACAQAPAVTNALPAATDTEAAPTEAPMNTTEPTATPDYLATEAAEATAAAADAVTDINAELEDLGLSTEGEVVWVQAEPIEVKQTSQDFDGVVEPLDEDLIVGDFTMGFDVTWETVTGFSGCGIVFRAEDMDRGKQIRFYSMRLSGIPNWFVDLYQYGSYQANLNWQPNNAIKSAQGSTNHYVITVDGVNMYGYANGTRIAYATLPGNLTEGQFGFFAWEDSGETTCTFENGWVISYPAE